MHEPYIDIKLCHEKLSGNVHIKYVSTFSSGIVRDLTMQDNMESVEAKSVSNNESS